MLMADSLGRLSGEDIARLEKIISKLDYLTERQEEIIKNVLAGEEEIGKRRIGYLKEYIDLYSKSLDTVITRKTSELSDAFLILDRYAQNGHKNNTKNTGSSNNTGNNPGGGVDAGGNTSSSGNNTSNNSGGGSNNGKDRKVKGTVTDGARAGLGDEAKTSDKIVDRRAAFLKEYKTIEKQIMAIEENKEQAVISSEQLRAAHQAQREKWLDEYSEKEETLEETLTALMVARTQTEEDMQTRVKGIQISRIQEVTKAELDAQNLINDIKAEQLYVQQNLEEAGELRAKESEAKDTVATLQALEEQRIKYIAKKELEAKRKNGGVLEKDDAIRIQKEAAAKFKLDEENLKKLNAKRVLLEAAHKAKDERNELKNLTNQAFHGETTTERYEAFKSLTTTGGEFDLKKTMTAAVLAVSDLAKQLEGQIDEIAKHKGLIDTRLQGSSNEKYAGSYWDQLVHDMTGVGAINPYFQQKDFAANIEKLVDKGIAFDLKQRAFLMTIQEKIANTFDVADGTLLRLVRIQQQDSTAGRLGMESALNSFLNEMYETSEYLSDVAKGVRSSLEEMQALMEGAEAAEVEYQVQKWLGSLYSVGMSQTAVNSISTALGQIAAGQIEGLTGSGASNLLIMAANDAGLSIADILTEGLDSSKANELLQAAVKYLAELADSSKDNQVVQQQLADVFGVKASDLRAATNIVLPGSTKAIYGSNLTYDNMLNQLFSMAGSMSSRTSMAEMMTNIWENGKYSLSGSIASNPVSYFIYKTAKLLDDAAGGIDLPFVNAMGFGVDLNTTVSDLMRVAAIGSGIIGSIGPLVSGLGNSFSGQAMLKQLGIKSGSNLAVTPRGVDGLLAGDGAIGGGNKTTSGSVYAGNASGSDVKSSTMQEAEDSKKQLMVEAVEEQEANQVTVLNTTVVKIYELLEDVVHGNSSVRVKVEGYGLTTAGNSKNSLGGVNGLGSNGSYSPGSGSDSGGQIGSVNSGGVSGSIDFGGWTTT